MVFFFLSLNFRHLSLITLKYHVCLVPSLTFHHLIFFTLFMGPIPITQCSFFSFFFLQYPNSPNLVKKKKYNTQNMKTEPVKEEEKKKKKPRTNRTRERRRRRKKKKKPRTDRTSERRKKKRTE